MKNTNDGSGELGVGKSIGQFVLRMIKVAMFILALFLFLWACGFFDKNAYAPSVTESDKLRYRITFYTNNDNVPFKLPANYRPKHFVGVVSATNTINGIHYAYVHITNCLPVVSIMSEALTPGDVVEVNSIFISGLEPGSSIPAHQIQYFANKVAR